MITTILQGFLLGLAYVAPIGAQNLYVIQNALQRNKIKAYKLAFVIFLFDISLAFTCFYGIGYLINLSKIVEAFILFFGFFVLIYLGIQLLFKNINEAKIKINNHSLFQGMIFAFIVTWFNPQAIIDGSLLLGSIHATLDPQYVHYFIIGVSLASFIWFHSLTTVIIFLNKQFSENIMKWSNIICGIILLLYGLKIGYSFIQLFFL